MAYWTLVLLPLLMDSLLIRAADWNAGPEWAALSSTTLEGYTCHQASRPILVDGKLNDPAWASVPWTRDFLDIEGPTKPLPRFRTRAKMLWDPSYFYVAAEITEPHVWGTITNHDAVIFNDNDFEVFIDPDGDGHQYYEFEMNVLNTGWDLRLVKAYKDGGPALNGWEIPGLMTAVAIQGTLNEPKDVDTGWTLEIAFPWKALGEFSKVPAPPRNGDRWRVNFSRVEWNIDTSTGSYVKVPKTKEDNWVWSPTGLIDMHRPEKWGIVEFTTLNHIKDPPVPGKLELARDRLQEVYYAQREFLKREKRWAKSVGELSPNPPDWTRNVQIGPVGNGYQATIAWQDSQNRHRLSRINDDGRFVTNP